MAKERRAMTLGTNDASWVPIKGRISSRQLRAFSLSDVCEERRRLWSSALKIPRIKGDRNSGRSTEPTVILDSSCKKGSSLH